jgi:hypothetical protein
LRWNGGKRSKGKHSLVKIMEFKLLILPGNLNDTPHGEDLLLLITEEEFLRMWRRGQALLKKPLLGKRDFDGGYAEGSLKIS